MGNLVFGSAERPGNSTDAAEISVVRDNCVAIGQGARPTERPEKAAAAARHRTPLITANQSETVPLRHTLLISTSKPFNYPVRNFTSEPMTKKL